MSLAHVEFDLYCEKHNGYYPAYRFWINDTMIVERTFRWETQEHYLRERITVDVEPESNNVIKIQNIGDSGKFIATNLTIKCENEKAHFSIQE